MKHIILALITVLAFTGCQSREYNTSYYDIFDTFSTFTMYGSSEQEFENLSSDLHQKLVYINKLFDIYNSYEGINNIKTINDNAGIAPVKVEPEIIDLIKAGKYAYNRTHGTVNIAMGSVLEIWHNYRENALDNNIYAIPSLQELQEAAKHTDINSIIIDEENSTVYISDKDTSLDVGAIAKGYAADYALKYLKENESGPFLLNLGGNVICTTGENKKNWTIGVTSPYDDDRGYIDKVTLQGGSAVSSGDYQRYYEYEGKRYHHIIDSTTLYPSDNNREVTVISDSSLEGDIFSTALFILPYEQGRALAEENNIEALWITADDEIFKTSAFDTCYTP